MLVLLRPVIALMHKRCIRRDQMMGAGTWLWMRYLIPEHGRPAWPVATL